MPSSGWDRGGRARLKVLTAGHGTERLQDVEYLGMRNSKVRGASWAASASVSIEAARSVAGTARPFAHRSQVVSASSRRSVCCRFWRS